MFDTKHESHLITGFSADGFCSQTERLSLESRYSEYLNITDKINRQSVSFQLNKNDNIHSWLKYKEGFSAQLVNMLLDEMGVGVGDIVMDPFIGSGTTAVECKRRGINSIGYDIMPFSAISIKAKDSVYQYDLEELRKMLAEISELEMPESFIETTNSLTITKGAYPKKNERFLEYVSRWRDNSNYSDNAKNLLTLCILNSLERISYTIKAGQYLGWDFRSEKVREINRIRQEKGQKQLLTKQVRKDILDAKDTIIADLKRTICDISVIQTERIKSNRSEIKFISNSALYEIPKLPDDMLNGVITSPPYCNRYDYTRTYALELAYLGVDETELKNLRQALLSCTVENRSKITEIHEFYDSIGSIDRFNCIYNKIKSNRAFDEIISALKKRKLNGDLNNNGIVRMVEGYFTELAFIYAELYRACKKGAMVAFVNDNVRYGGEVIPVDFLSCSFAEQFGFKVKEIYSIKQQKGNSSQQMAKFGRVPLRKSITVWVKE